MPESAVRAERFDSSSSLPSYIWEVSGKPVVARIGLEMIDRLEQEVVENFRSLNSRGSEIGGLLLGSVQPGSPLRVTVENYELIACDYSRGPLYRFSEADVERFDRALQQRVAGNQRVVGFFRSHTRKGLALDAEDIAFFTGHFRDAHQVALLVRPYASKPSTAGIFIWENGAIRGDASYHEFPFRRLELENNSGTQAPAEREQPAPAANPAEASPARPTVRAQIVPIASRREAALPSNPQLSTQTDIPKPAEQPAAEKVTLHRTPEKAMPVQKTPSPVAQKTEPSMPVPKPEASSPVPPSSSPKAPVAERPTTVDKPASAEKTVAAEKPAITEKPSGRDKPVAAEKSSEKPVIAEPTAEKAPATEAAQKSPQSSLAEKTAPIPKFTSGFDSVSTKNSDEAEAPKSGSKKLMWLAGGAAAALVLLSGVLIYPGMLHKSSRTSGSGADPSGLSLRVERSAGELLLSWNRDSEALKNAAHASLAIHDGQQNENVDLDMSQLRNGSIVYSPSTSDVVFQLSVVGKDSSKIQSESVRILRTRPSALDTPGNEPAPATAAKATNTNSPAAPAASTPAPANNQPAATPAETEKSETADATPAPTKAPLKPFQSEALSQRLRPARPSDLPDAPGLTATQQVAVNLPGTNLMPPAPIAPPPPSPATKLGGQVTTAVLVTRVNPDYPAAARQSRLQGSVLISAIVGTDGHVKSAKAVSGHPLLQGAAVTAVKQWVYKPALLNGNPVESEMRVELNFTLGH